MSDWLGKALKGHAHRAGYAAETAACRWLCKQGYRILDRRVRTPFGEIDVIAQKSEVTIFAEVKYRRSHDNALAAVTLHQARRIVSAAQHWLCGRSETLAGVCRFDIIAVSAGLETRHVPDAFAAEDVV